MPSLRELWQQVIMFDKREMSPRFCAVMERLVEAVEPQECPQGCDATIRKLREELGKTKAAYAGATERISALRAMLAEVLAEIERLRPLAELGELVRGMRPNSRLTHWHTEYSVEVAENYVWKKSGPRPGWSIASAAEALRAIQEVGDAEV